MPQTKEWVRTAAAVGTLLAAVVLFYWKITLTDRATWFDSPDYAYQVLPWYQFQAGEWHQGRVPLWNPHEWSGQSLIGQAQPGSAYPLNWLLFLMPLKNGWMQGVYLSWYFVLIHWIGAVFAYWLARDLGRSRLASIVGGVAFGVGGWMGSVEWPQMLNGAAWLPLVVMFLLRVARRHEVARSAGLGGAALGMAFLSGHHQAPTFIAIAAAGLWIWAAMKLGRRVLPAGAIFGAMFALVGALQMLPAWEYGRLAVRWVGSDHDPVGWKDTVPYVVQSHFGMTPMALLGLVIPDFRVHASAHIGFAICALALVGAAVWWRETAARALALLAVGGALYSVANFTVFQGMIYGVMPMVEKARTSSLAILVCHGAVAALAAFGIDALREQEQAGAQQWMRRVEWVLWGAAAVLGAVVLKRGAGMLDERVVMAPVMAAATAAVLFVMRRRWLRWQVGVAALGVVAFLEFMAGGSPHGWRQRTDPGSLLPALSRDGDIAEYLQKQGVDGARLEVEMDAVRYNFGSWWGIDTFDTYTASMLADMFKWQAETRARRLMGFRYFLGRTPAHKDQVEVMTGRSGLKLFANPGADRSAWAVHEIKQVPEDRLPFQWEPTMEELRRRSFMTAAPPSLDTCATPDTVRMLRREPGRVELEARMACRGMVVLGEAWSPGWEATVDGRPATVWKPYEAMRGVVTEAGAHRIEFRYRPWTVQVGAAMTALGFLLAGVMVCYSRFKSII